MLHRLGARRDLNPILAPDAVRVLDQSRRFSAIPLNPAFPEASRRICRKSLADLIQADLLTAGTRIEREDLHQYGQLQFFTSGISSPCSWTYCLCSTNLSRRNCLK